MPSAVPNPGDFVTVTIAGEPLIVARGKDGVVRVMSAVCQHRGMLVAEGQGTCGTFTCPYHHWIYGLDGRLLGAQSMERTVGFDKKEWGLPVLRTEDWHGFLFVTFDPDIPALAPRMAALEPFVEDFELDACSGRPTTDLYAAMPWNWKVMFENFNDGYHANKLHQGVHDFCRSEDARFPIEWDDENAFVMRTNRFVHIDGGFNATQKAILPLFPGLTDEERWRVTFALVPPTLTLGLAPDQVFYFLIRPLTADSIDVEIGYLLPPESARGPSLRREVRPLRARCPGHRDAGRQRHHARPARAPLPLRPPRPLRLAGGDPPPAQPLAGRALPPTLADLSAGRAPQLSIWRRKVPESQ